MSDSLAGRDSSVFDEAEPSRASALTAGQLLRQARGAAGLHIAALAVSLKVPVRKLEALENDRLDELPDAVFARALASSVCRALRIDPQPVLRLLPSSDTPRLDTRDAGLNAPFRAPGDGPAPAAWSAISRPAALVVGALLIAALALLFWPASWTTAPKRAAAAPEVIEAPAPSAVPMVTQEPVSAAPSAPAVAPPAAAPAPAAPAPSIAVAAPVAAPAPAAGIAVFTATGTSWLEVRDFAGAVVLQRTLQAGETASASGALPMSVIVGRADAMRVQVRGRELDVKALARENVARFEVR